MVYFLLVLLALAFGLIEGVTEWLPISSTGHMVLFEEILKLGGFDMSSYFGFTHGEDFISLFLVVIQLGAILAVLVYFFPKLWPFWHIKRKEEDERSQEEIDIENKKNRRLVWIRWGKTVLGVLPVAVVGLLFEYFDVEEKLSNWICIATTLIVYGVAFLLVEYLFVGKKEPKYKNIDELPWKIAFLIGLSQILALMPGTSRSGVTIIAAMLLLSSREAAAEYSFYLSIPVMFGASLLKIISFFRKSGVLCLNEWLFLGVGMVVAFVISLLVVRWLMAFLKKHTFKGFGYYRIALGIVIVIVFAIGLAAK